MAQGATGCQLFDGVMFSNFTFSSSATGTGTLPAASQLTYTLLNPGRSFDGDYGVFGFIFDPNLSVSGIGSEDIQIGFDVGGTLTGRHLGETALVTNGASATVTEGPDCGVSLFGGSCVPIPDLTVTVTNPFIDSYGFLPQGVMDQGFEARELQVQLDINVTSTTANGSASISGFETAVDIFPEPASVVLMLAGFASLATCRKWLIQLLL